MAADSLCTFTPGCPRLAIATHNSKDMSICAACLSASSLQVRTVPGSTARRRPIQPGVQICIAEIEFRLKTPRRKMIELDTKSAAVGLSLINLLNEDTFKFPLPRFGVSDYRTSLLTYTGHTLYVDTVGCAYRCAQMILYAVRENYPKFADIAGSMRKAFQPPAISGSRVQREHYLFSEPKEIADYLHTNYGLTGRHLLLNRGTGPVPDTFKTRKRYDSIELRTSVTWEQISSEIQNAFDGWSASNVPILMCDSVLSFVIFGIRGTEILVADPYNPNEYPINKDTISTFFAWKSIDEVLRGSPCWMMYIPDAVRYLPLDNPVYDLSGSQDARTCYQYLQWGGSFFDTSPLRAGGEVSPFELTATDWCFPVCHQGQCRSQAMYLSLLEDLEKFHPGNIGDWVGAPHGATNGCDPWHQAKVLSDENFWKYTFDPFPDADIAYNCTTDIDPDGGPKARGYAAAFKHNRFARIGEDMAHKHQPLNLIPDRPDFKNLHTNRSAAREWFNEHYYKTGPKNPMPKGATRRVFFSFVRGAGKMLLRLVENGSTACANTVIVAIDEGDLVSTALRQLPDEIKNAPDREARTTVYMAQAWRDQVAACKRYYTAAPL